MGVSEVAGTDGSVNEIFGRYGASYAALYGVTGEQRRVLQDITDCHSGALGGHIDQCDSCGEVQYRNHSGRNRHCPQCEGGARAEWLLKRGEELLPAPYYHGVFTVDHIWNEVMRWNQQLCYDLLYSVVNGLLKEYGQRYLGGEVGFIGVLYTWGQQLTYHVHLHCIILGGALRSDGVFVASSERQLLPVVALAADFRQRFCDGIGALLQAGKLQLPAGWDTAHIPRQQQASQDKAWEVYLKPPFGKPGTVLEYLAGYVNRIAISNSRIQALTADQVTFRYRDYRDEGAVKSMTLPVHEFMRRFLQHVLPAGFVRIRYFGLWHSGQRHKLAQIRQQLAKEYPGIAPETLTFWFRPLYHDEKQRCPACGEGSLVCIGEFEGTRRQLTHRQRRRLLPSERKWIQRRAA